MEAYERHGQPILVNTQTEGGQSAPRAAKFAAGGFVVIWVDLNGVAPNTSVAPIRAQIFTDAGEKVGGEIAVGSIALTTVGSSVGVRSMGAVTTFDDGRFLVVWPQPSAPGDASGLGLVGQYFSATGAPVGANFLVNSSTKADQHTVSLATLSDGGFVAVWQDRGGDGDGPGVRGRMFGSNGAASGPDFILNTNIYGVQSAPVVTALASGGFAAAWSTPDLYGSATALQLFDSAGARVGAEQRVNPPYSSSNSPALTQLVNGNLLVVWSEYVDDSVDVLGQLFSPGGSPIGAPFEIGAESARAESARIAALPDGGFFVSWMSAVYPEAQTDIRGQRFDASAQKIGGEVIIPSQSGLDQATATPLALTSGEIVTVYLDYSATGGDTSNRAIRAQFLALSGPGSEPGAVDGGGGDDILAGTAGADWFRGFGGSDLIFLHLGGDDRVDGGEGDDGFYFGDAFDASDQVDGGAGDDQLGLQGNYNLTLGAAVWAGVETLVLLSGSGSGWWWDMAPTSYDYALATHDANVAAGAVLVVSANGLEAGEDLSFDGSAETDGAFTIYAGFGKETLTGGQLSDGFFFGEGRFSAGDIVSGGGGGDDQMGIRGNYTIDFNAAGFTGVTGIETLVLISANDPRYLSPAGVTEFDYALILADSMAAAGGQLTVTGVGLGSAETMNVDGSAEASASLRLIGGASADTLTGGGGNDLIFGGLGADMLRGNGGADRFVYTDVAQSRSAGGIDRIVGFQSGVDKIDLSAIDGDPTIEGIQALDFRTMFEPGGAGTLRVMAGHDPSQAGNYYTVSADLDGDNIADFTIHVWSTGQLTQSDFIGVS